MASILHSLRNRNIKPDTEPKTQGCYLCGKQTRSHQIGEKMLCHGCHSGMDENELKSLEQRIVVNIGVREREKMKTMEMVKSMRRPEEPKTLVEKTLEDVEDEG